VWLAGRWPTHLSCGKTCGGGSGGCHAADRRGSGKHVQRLRHAQQQQHQQQLEQQEGELHEAQRSQACFRPAVGPGQACNHVHAPACMQPSGQSRADGGATGTAAWLSMLKLLLCLRPQTCSLDSATDDEAAGAPKGVDQRLSQKPLGSAGSAGQAGCRAELIGPACDKALADTEGGDTSGCGSSSSASDGGSQPVRSAGSGTASAVCGSGSGGGSSGSGGGSSDSSDSSGGSGRSSRLGSCGSRLRSCSSRHGSCRSSSSSSSSSSFGRCCSISNSSPDRSGGGSDGRGALGIALGQPLHVVHGCTRGGSLSATVGGMQKSNRALRTVHSAAVQRLWMPMDEDSTLYSALRSHHLVLLDERPATSVSTPGSTPKGSPRPSQSPDQGSSCCSSLCTPSVEGPDGGGAFGWPPPFTPPPPPHGLLVRACSAPDHALEDAHPTCSEERLEGLQHGTEQGTASPAAPMERRHSPPRSPLRHRSRALPKRVPRTPPPSPVRFARLARAASTGVQPRQPPPPPPPPPPPALLQAVLPRERKHALLLHAVRMSMADDDRIMLDALDELKAFDAARTRAAVARAAALPPSSSPSPPHFRTRRTSRLSQCSR